MLIKVSLLLLTGMLLFSTSLTESGSTATTPDFDLLIKNGTIVDGSGQPGYRSDMAIQGDRILRIGNLKMLLRNA